MCEGGDETDRNEEVPRFLAHDLELGDVLLATAALTLRRISAGQRGDLRSEIAGLESGFFGRAMDQYRESAVFAALQRRRVGLESKLDKCNGKLRRFVLCARYRDRRRARTEIIRRKNDQRRGRRRKHQRGPACDGHLV